MAQISISNVLGRRKKIRIAALLASACLIFLIGGLILNKPHIGEAAGVSVSGNTTTLDGGGNAGNPGGFYIDADGTIYNGQSSIDRSDSSGLYNVNGKDLVITNDAEVTFAGGLINLNSLVVQGNSTVTHLGPGPDFNDINNTDYNYTANASNYFLPTDYYGILYQGYFRSPTAITNLVLHYDDNVRIYWGVAGNLQTFIDPTVGGQCSGTLLSFCYKSTDGTGSGDRYHTAVIGNLAANQAYQFKIYYVGGVGDNHIYFQDDGNMGAGTNGGLIPANDFFASQEVNSYASVSVQAYNLNHMAPAYYNDLGLPNDALLKGDFSGSNLLYVNTFQTIGVNLSTSPRGYKVDGAFFDWLDETSNGSGINPNRLFAMLGDRYTYDRGINLDVAGDVTLSDTSNINVDGKGYAGGWLDSNNVCHQQANGPGKGGNCVIANGNTTNSGAGGSFAGQGAPPVRSTNPGVGSTYNYMNTSNQVEFGSGGQAIYASGDDNDWAGSWGGSGGGRVVLQCNNLTLSGTSYISANGTPGKMIGTNYSLTGGAGSGGAIVITANSVNTPSGSSANVNGGPSNDPNEVGGIGRIQVANFSGSLNQLFAQGGSDKASYGWSYGAGGGGGWVVVNIPGAATITAQKTLYPVSRPGSGSLVNCPAADIGGMMDNSNPNCFNPYALQMSDRIKVDLKISGATSGGYTLQDNWLSTPSGLYYCSPYTDDGSDGGSGSYSSPAYWGQQDDRVIRFTEDQSVTEIYYQCHVIAHP